MTKVWNALNYHLRPRTDETNTKPSQTVPDQAMSMKEILERYAKGLPISSGNEPIYEDENEPTNGINPRTLDLVDLQEIKMNNEHTIEYLRETVKNNEKKRKNSEKTVADEEQPQP
jgi:hypothetical protein